MKRGIEPVNSDEEHNMVLDETQQEKFISEMNLIATQYIATWRKMFAWTSLLILYVNAFSLLGLVPLSRHALAILTPKSVTLNLFLSPIYAGSFFFTSPLAPIFVQLASLFSLMWSVKQCMRKSASSYASFSRLNRLLGLGAFSAWTFLAYLYNIPNPFWGRHLVLSLSVPLQALAAETYRSACETAREGVDKLEKFKYSHKKV
jgi:hypothetical protein